MRRAYSANSWMLGATTAVSRRTGGLLSSGGDELGDGLMEQVGLLPLHPVAALRDGAHGHVWEEVGELVAPGCGEDRVAIGPEDERGGADGEVPLEAAAHSAEHGAVAVEAASQGAGLGEGVHVALYLRVRPERLVVRPVGEPVAEVYLRGLAAGADQLLGQGELVEEHVPYLAVAVRREEAGGYAGIGGLEEYEAVYQLRMSAHEALRPDGAEIVGDDVDLREAEVLHQGAQVFGHDLVGVALFRRQVRLIGVAVAAHVRDHVIEPLGEGLDVEVPLVPEAGPAVNEEEGRPAALADVVVAQAVYGGVFVVEAIGLTQAGAAPIWGGLPASRQATQVNFIRWSDWCKGRLGRRRADDHGVDRVGGLYGQTQGDAAGRGRVRDVSGPHEEDRVGGGGYLHEQPLLAGAG